MLETEIQRAIRYLKILDLEAGATLLQVKQAYRTLVKVWHPDRFPSDTNLQNKAQEKLKELNAAYEGLIENVDILSKLAGWSQKPEEEHRFSKPQTDPSSDSQKDNPSSPPPSDSQSPPKVPKHSDINFEGRKYIFVAFAVAVMMIVAWNSGILTSKNSTPVSETPAPGIALSKAIPPQLKIEELPTYSSQVGSQTKSDNPKLSDQVRTLGKKPVVAGPNLEKSVEANRPSSEPFRLPEKALKPPPETSHQSDNTGRTAELSKLTQEESESVAAVCSQAKSLQGPSSYKQCVANQLKRLQTNIRRPDLSGLAREEHESIEAACSKAKSLQGPSAYNKCLSNQLQNLASTLRRPDLSDWTREEMESIEAACSKAKYLQGPSAYNQCLASQLRELASGLRRPSLAKLTREERDSVEAVCSRAQYLQGPAFYNACVHQQLQSLGMQEK